MADDTRDRVTAQAARGAQTHTPFVTEYLWSRGLRATAQRSQRPRHAQARRIEPADEGHPCRKGVFCTEAEERLRGGSSEQIRTRGSVLCTGDFERRLLRTRRHCCGSARSERLPAAAGCPNGGNGVHACCTCHRALPKPRAGTHTVALQAPAAFVGSAAHRAESSGSAATAAAMREGRQACSTSPDAWPKRPGGMDFRAPITGLCGPSWTNEPQDDKRRSRRKR